MLITKTVCNRTVEKVSRLAVRTNDSQSAVQPSRGITVRIHPSICEIPRDAWMTLFPQSDQSWDYYSASERMRSRGFVFGAIGAYAGEVLVAAAPLFRVDYRLDAPLSAPFQAIGDWLQEHAPSWITMPIMGLGSPISDECQIGIRADLSLSERQVVLEALLRGLSQHADDNGVRVLLLKDLTEADRMWAEPTLRSANFSGIPSLPVATLELPYATVDEYLLSLPPKMRQDLRRKRRQSIQVRVEYRSSIEGIEDKIADLYSQTRAHRKASFDVFDELPLGYFREVMTGLNGRARLLLLWVGENLACFNLFILERDRVMGRYLGLQYPLAREHNLYFINWLAMVEYCIENGYRQLQVGQSSYALKAKLGCQFHRSWIYFKHTGAVRGPVFRLLSPYAAFDRMDPDLRELGSAAPYVIP